MAEFLISEMFCVTTRVEFEKNSISMGIDIDFINEMSHPPVLFDNDKKSALKLGCYFLMGPPGDNTGTVGKNLLSLSKIKLSRLNL